MKGIKKCSGDGCPVKETCLRFTVHSDNLWQSNIAPAWDEKRKTCWNLIGAKKGEK